MDNSTNIIEITNDDIDKFLSYINSISVGENVQLTELEAEKYKKIIDIMEGTDSKVLDNVKIDDETLKRIQEPIDEIPTKIEITDKDVEDFENYIKKTNSGEEVEITPMEMVKYNIMLELINGNEELLENLIISDSTLEKLKSLFDDLTDDDDDETYVPSTYNTIVYNTQPNEMIGMDPDKIMAICNQISGVVGDDSGMITNLALGYADENGVEDYPGDIIGLANSYRENSVIWKLTEISQNYLYDFLILISIQKSTLLNFLNYRCRTYENTNDAVASYFVFDE